MILIDKYKAWRSAERPAPLDLIHIWRVIKAFVRKRFIKDPTDYRAEQAAWRLNEKVSPLCKQAGSCIICGCTTEDLVWDDASCEGNCYPPMMDAKTWDSYKKQNKIYVNATTRKS